MITGHWVAEINIKLLSEGNCDPHVQVKLTIWGSADILSDHIQGQGSRPPSSDLISVEFQIQTPSDRHARLVPPALSALQCVCSYIVLRQTDRGGSQVKSGWGENPSGEPPVRAGRKMNVSCFFCSSLIKANDGLSRSLYAYHRQTAGCNELLSGTWQISRKQAAVLVSAVLIGEGLFFFF